MTKNDLLQGKSIALRAVEPEDASIMWLIDNDSSQWIDNCMTAPLSRESMLVYASTYDADPMRSGEIRLIIETEGIPGGDGRKRIPAGIIDVTEISSTQSRAFIGVYIRPEHRRRGLALDSLITVEKYLANVLNLERIGAKISSDNRASVSLFEKAGYNLSGNLMNWIKSGKKYADLLIYVKEIG